MKLLRLRVDGFGALRGEFSFDPARVAVIVDQNETGKSTLLAAVSAALYGLDGDKRRWPALTPLERWRPWDNGSYGLQLELESRGETYTVRRDFGRGTVEVWNGQGQEVTAEFRDGRDSFPVGRKLLGLDLEEFEKCAFVRQNDLEQVVPDEEKVRHAGTLQARLESAADTRGGDTNATEAIQVLEAAAKKYTCPEVEFTGLVENAIQRIENKRTQLDTQVKALERELAQVAGPLAELSRLGEEEAVARVALSRLDDERKGTLSSEIRARLSEDDERRAEVAKLEAEAADLAACAHVPDNAEAELSQTVGQLEQAQRNLDSFEGRHRDETARERSSLEAEVAGYQAVASSTAADADRLIALASEMRRLADEDGRRRAEMTSLREQLSGKGVDQERAGTLAKRMTSLDEEQLKLLRGQSEIGLVFQSELQALEAQRNESTAALRGIDVQRGGLRIPGWLLVVLGFGGAIGGGALVALAAPQRLWTALLGGGAGLVVLGGLLLTAASGMRKRERVEALRSLTDAQRKINQLRSRRVESEQALLELSRSLGYPNPIELMRDWNEHSRLTDASAPMRRTQEQLVSLETARRAVFEETRALLERFGGGAVDLGRVERVATDIRSLARLRERVERLDSGWGWVADEKRTASAEAAGHRERALRILQAAGLVYDPDKPWAEHLGELAGRVRGKGRLRLLRDELIPQARRRAMPEAQRSELEAQLRAIEAERPRVRSGSEAALRSAFEVDKEARQLRDRIDEMQKRRTEVRVRVDEVCRRYEAEHPERLLQIARLDRARVRAQRFKRATDLAAETIRAVALDTHRRWAEFLNQRVAELLGQFGARVDELRFGQDLDFSLRLWNGQQVSRGKGVNQLSTGARDQLYLAIRLAISEFLSPPDDPLPLLIDDVYATSDDERTRAGMRLLIEHFAGRHQIIIVSCHRSRLESLARLDPELYRSKVQLLDARTSTLTF